MAKVSDFLICVCVAWIVFRLVRALWLCWQGKYKEEDEK